MNCELLNTLNGQIIQFLIKHLTQICYNVLMDLLPEMSSEDLNERNLQCGNLSMHEDTCQIQLHLETNINICSIDRW